MSFVLFLHFLTPAYLEESELNISFKFDDLFNWVIQKLEIPPSALWHFLITFTWNIHRCTITLVKTKKNPAQFSGLLEWLHLQGNDPLGRQETSLDHTAGNTENWVPKLMPSTLYDYSHLFIQHSTNIWEAPAILLNLPICEKALNNTWHRVSIKQCLL